MIKRSDNIEPNWLTYAILLTASVYTLPWLHNPGAALTGNAYELAEWATLHPPLLDGVSPLTTALLLRLPLVLLACFAAYDFSNKPSLFRLTILIALLIASLPPVEFLSDRSNENYFQQFALTTAAVVGSGIIMILHRIRPSVATSTLFSLGLGGFAVCLLGMFQVRELMIGFSMPVELGVGGMLSAFGFTLMGLTFARTMRS